MHPVDVAEYAEALTVVIEDPELEDGTYRLAPGHKIEQVRYRSGYQVAIPVDESFVVGQPDGSALYRHKILSASMTLLEKMFGDDNGIAPNIADNPTPMSIGIWTSPVLDGGLTYIEPSVWLPDMAGALGLGFALGQKSVWHWLTMTEIQCDDWARRALVVPPVVRSLRPND